jgi:predicted transcriptional regulator
VFEASAKEPFGKDFDKSEIEDNYMLGGGTFDHCKSANSYAMTDTKPWKSQLDVLVNGKSVGKYDLADDPADHRGILSWGSQPHTNRMLEAGSYGELFQINIPIELLQKDRKTVIRFVVPEETQNGGLAIYGKDFGRYPLDPTLVLKLK